MAAAKVTIGKVNCTFPENNVPSLAAIINANKM